MAEIGTATVKVTPVIDEDALAQVDAAVREAVADALRKVADSLVAKPNEAGTDEPRFTLYAEPHGKGWAIRDATNPDIEAHDARRSPERPSAGRFGRPRGIPSRGPPNGRERGA